MLVIHYGGTAGVLTEKRDGRMQTERAVTSQPRPRNSVGRH